jgi:hypothetical protein
MRMIDAFAAFAGTAGGPGWHAAVTAAAHSPARSGRLLLIVETLLIRSWDYPRSSFVVSSRDPRFDAVKKRFRPLTPWPTFIFPARILVPFGAAPTRGLTATHHK